MSKEDKIIQKRIRESRRNRGLTQKQLADSISLSPNYLSQIECGKRGISIALLNNIADALNCSVAYLVGEIDDIDEQEPFSNELKDKLKQMADIQFNVALTQLSDPEKLAIVNMLDGLERDKIRKVYDFLHDQKRLSDLEKEKGA
jgi:transcriptional regulator with XRE-family HTH domain